jgi:hypothetical protein
MTIPVRSSAGCRCFHDLKQWDRVEKPTTRMNRGGNCPVHKSQRWQHLCRACKKPRLQSLCTVPSSASGDDDKEDDGSLAQHHWRGHLSSSSKSSEHLLFYLLSVEAAIAAAHPAHATRIVDAGPRLALPTPADAGRGAPPTKGRPVQ